MKARVIIDDRQSRKHINHFLNGMGFSEITSESGPGCDLWVLCDADLTQNNTADCPVILLKTGCKNPVTVQADVELGMFFGRVKFTKAVFQAFNTYASKRQLNLFCSHSGSIPKEASNESWAIFQSSHQAADFLKRSPENVSAVFIAPDFEGEAFVHDLVHGKKTNDIPVIYLSRNPNELEAYRTYCHYFMFPNEIVWPELFNDISILNNRRFETRIALQNVRELKKDSQHIKALKQLKKIIAQNPISLPALCLGLELAEGKADLDYFIQKIFLLNPCYPGLYIKAARAEVSHSSELMQAASLYCPQHSISQGRRLNASH